MYTPPKKVCCQYYQDQDRSNFFARYCLIVTQAKVPMNPPGFGGGGDKIRIDMFDSSEGIVQFDH